MERIIKKKYVSLVLVLLLVVLYIVLYKIYMPRVNAFGCFDDCNNFMGGYFLLHGKRLFSEIFFNHNPIMAYISWIVQFVTHPQNLYELILRHRQALFLFGFFFNTLLIIRFGVPAFGFVIFYELTKFYLFGDRFLAETFIVYPLVYLVGLAWLKFQNKKIVALDYIASGVFVWFVVFMREPYVPVVLLLFLYLLWNKIGSKNWLHQNKNSILAFTIFFILSIFTIFLHDIAEFFFNVVTVNLGLASGETKDMGIVGLLKIFLYPINLFFGGERGYFRYIMLSLNVLFLASSIIMVWKKQWKAVIFFWVILGFLSIRYIEPGKAFYSAFHLLCWYGVFLFASFMMLEYIHKINKKLSILFTFLYSCALLFYIISPSSFFHNKPDPHYELITNYGIPMQVGRVVNIISTSKDTLFVDGFDDIIYWQSQRVSSYKYSWYTSLMPEYKKYTDARIEMFRKSPPDFYYGSCPKEKNSKYLLPDFIKDKYIRLYSDKKPSCLWVKRAKVASINSQQWVKAEMNLYYLPKEVFAPTELEGYTQPI